MWWCAAIHSVIFDSSIGLPKDIPKIPQGKTEIIIHSNALLYNFQFTRISSMYHLSAWISVAHVKEDKKCLAQVLIFNFSC